MATYPLLQGVDSIHDFYCRLLVVWLGISIVQETHVCFPTFPFYTLCVFSYFSFLYSVLLFPLCLFTCNKTPKEKPKK